MTDERETCGNCRYYNGQCRRNPPVVAGLSISSHTISRWPNTEPDEWCGEWKPSGLLENQRAQRALNLTEPKA